MHIEDVIARGRSATRYFPFSSTVKRAISFLPSLAQNDLVDIRHNFSAELRWIPLGKLNLFAVRILRRPFKETERGVIRC